MITPDGIEEAIWKLGVQQEKNQAKLYDMISQCGLEIAVIEQKIKRLNELAERNSLRAVEAFEIKETIDTFKKKK